MEYVIWAKGPASEREREREVDRYYVCQNSHALNDSLVYKWLDILFFFCGDGWGVVRSGVRFGESAGDWVGVVRFV